MPVRHVFCKQLFFPSFFPFLTVGDPRCVQAAQSNSNLLAQVHMDGSVDAPGAKHQFD